MRLADDRPEEERVGDRDLTRWPSRAGGLLVRLVTGLAANVSVHAVLYLTAAVGLGLAVG